MWLKSEVTGMWRGVLRRAEAQTLLLTGSELLSQELLWLVCVRHSDSPSWASWSFPDKSTSTILKSTWPMEKFLHLWPIKLWRCRPFPPCSFFNSTDTVSSSSLRESGTSLFISQTWHTHVKLRSSPEAPQFLWRNGDMPQHILLSSHMGSPSRTLYFIYMA